MLSATDLEAIFEKYDGSCLTSNGCFYDDLPDLTDDEVRCFVHPNVAPIPLF